METEKLAASELHSENGDTASTSQASVPVQPGLPSGAFSLTDEEEEDEEDGQQHAAEWAKAKSHSLPLSGKPPVAASPEEEAAEAAGEAKSPEAILASITSPESLQHGWDGVASTSSAPMLSVSEPLGLSGLPSKGLHAGTAATPTGGASTRTISSGISFDRPEGSVVSASHPSLLAPPVEGAKPLGESPSGASDPSRASFSSKAGSRAGDESPRALAPETILARLTTSSRSTSEDVGSPQVRLGTSSSFVDVETGDSGLPAEERRESTGQEVGVSDIGARSASLGSRSGSVGSRSVDTVALGAGTSHKEGAGTVGGRKSAPPPRAATQSPNKGLEGEGGDVSGESADLSIEEEDRIAQELIALEAEAEAQAKAERRLLPSLNSQGSIGREGGGESESVALSQYSVNLADPDHAAMVEAQRETARVQGALDGFEPNARPFSPPPGSAPSPHFDPMVEGEGGAFEPAEFKGLLYYDGVDSVGRPVVVLNADVVSEKTSRRAACAFMLQRLEPIVVQGPYIFVLLNTGHTKKSNRLPAGWLISAYRSLSRPFRKNVKYIVLVRPSQTLKAMLAVLRPFTSRKASRKIVKVESLSGIEAATGGEVKLEHLGPRFASAAGRLVATTSGNLSPGSSPGGNAFRP